MRYFNWKLATVLLLGFGIIAGTVVGLHSIRKSGRYEEYYDQGMQSFEQGQWKDATENLGKYIRIDRQNSDVLHKYAQAQLKIRPSKRGNIQQASEAFREILRIDSGDKKAVKQLVEIYLQTGAIGEARLVAQRFLQDREGQDSDVKRLLAEAMIQQREFSEAYSTLKSVIENEPNQIKVYERLVGVTLGHPDDFEETAMFWLDLAIQNNPESASAYLARARFHLRNQKEAAATRDLEAALTQTLSDPEEHLNAAVLYRAVGQMELAKEQLDAIQACQPDHLAMWVFRAGAAFLSQDKEEMRRVANQGLTHLSENKWEFYPLAAELFVRAETYDKAGDCLRILSEQGTYPAEVAFLEGLIAIQKKHAQAAVQKWQRALALGYGSFSTYRQRYLGFKPASLKLLLASAQAQLGDTMSSRQLLESVASDNEEDMSVQLSLARHMAQMGDWTQAKTYVQRVLERNPRHAKAALLDLEVDVKLLNRQGISVDPSQWESIEQRRIQLSEFVEDAVSLSLLKFQISLNRQDLDTATSILEEMNPSDPVDQRKVTVAWVNLLFAQNRTDEIITRLRTAVEQHDQSAQMVRLLADFLSEAGDNNAVEKVLSDGMLKINDPTQSLNLGIMLSDFLTEWDQEGKKKSLLERLDQKFPNTISVQRKLLQCASLIEQPQKAQTIIDKIRSLEGDEGWQWRYEQAKLWFMQKNFENKYSEAVSLLQKNLRNNGNDQFSRRMLAAVYSKAGQSSQALATYRNALNREPYNLSIIIPAVRTLQAAKEFDEADAILNRVAKKDLTDPTLDRLQVNSYLQRGQVASAAKLMQSCLTDDPNNIGIAMDLAKLKVSQKEYDVAKGMLEKIKESTQEQSVTFGAERLTIQMLLYQGLPDEALQRCNDLVTQCNNAESLELRYTVKLLLGQDKGAVSDLDKALEFKPDDADLWVKKSSLHWSLQQKEKAMAAIDKAVVLSPSDPNVVVQAINIFVATQESDRIQAAQALLERATKQHSDDHRLKIQKVRFMLMDGDAASQIQAEVYLEKLTIDHPKEAAVWQMLCELLMAREDWAKAQSVAIRGLTQLENNLRLLNLKAKAEMRISPMFAVQTLEAMLEQLPGNVSVILDLAGAQIKARRPQRAIEVLNVHRDMFSKKTEVATYQFTMLNALLASESEAEASILLAKIKEKYPDDPRIVMVQISHWIGQDKMDAVEQAVMHGLEINPEETESVEYAARMLRRVGQAKAMALASHLLSAALKKQPESETLLMDLAQLWQAQGAPEKARELYEKVLQINGDNVIALNNLAWIYGKDLNQLEKALKLAQKGVALAPQYTDVLDTYGTLCYEAEKYKNAIKSLKECLNRPSYKSSSALAATMYTLAKSYLAIGDRSNASLVFRQCLDRNRQEDNGALNPEQYNDADRQLVSLMGN